MRKKLPIPADLGRRLKAARALINLKHRLRADDEINDSLATITEVYWKAVHKGLKPAPSAVERALIADLEST